MATPAIVGWVTALVSSFYNSLYLLLISLNTSISFNEQVVVCNFGRYPGPPVLLAVSLTGFTFRMVLKRLLRIEKTGYEKTDNGRKMCGTFDDRNTA